MDTTITTIAMLRPAVVANERDTRQVIGQNAAVKHGHSTDKIDQVVKDFEKMFLAQMLQPMFEGLSTDGMFGGGRTEKVMRSFMIDGYAQQMVDAGFSGFGDELRQQLINMQEKG